MWLFVFGTVELVRAGWSGRRRGPVAHLEAGRTQSSTWSPGGQTMLEVQVIGQQWAWTYRYPQFGGMESSKLMLPVNTPVDVPRDVAGRDPQLLGLPVSA